MEHIANELRCYFADRGITQLSIANELHVSKAYINVHFTGRTSTVTDIYINYNNRSVDEANRKVIDFINNL